MDKELYPKERQHFWIPLIIFFVHNLSCSVSKEKLINHSGIDLETPHILSLIYEWDHYNRDYQTLLKYHRKNNNTIVITIIITFNNRIITV